MRVTHRRVATVVLALAVLPSALLGCGIVGDDEKPAEKPGRAPAEEAAAKSRERVQAYLDAMTAKDVAAGRSQLCAALHQSFDASATGPNGDFADHFQVPQAEIVDVRAGGLGQQVSASVSVTVGSRKVTRALLFTVTRDGADWCIAGEAPGGNTPEPAATP
ncbi:hypothetical protein [Micromonospora endolithica]|uniref:Nuclear transport factor 2 family protein n=1 Tax=Micromonospora endolithica TaxID=230091 RepID=A0A3A9ZSY7_9ACTN|nr:hypothetical protein [Micromonospora endolithica]RKN51320.1 hypothetical protein D7223_03475 [Micromonospora endolithica]TWJ20415.1 hypothetical protein JD76_00513 [Micromonospora endolithica]